MVKRFSSEKERKLYQDRLKKVEKLRGEGVEPYPSKAARTHAVDEVLKSFSKLNKTKKKIVLTGRVRAVRTHGGLIFGSLEDGSGQIQFLLKEEEVGAARLADFENYFDVGDFLEARGRLMKTKRGEKTLLVTEYKMLAKALRGLPEKWHGLTDKETRLRKRYLDMIANPEVRELFRKKSVFWKAMRTYLEEMGFMEIDTPALEDVAGGAAANPFITHHDALDRDFYLRISLELPLKKAIIGGFEKVYEIGKVFRNEGISSEHLQDYLMMECYWAYADFEKMMRLVEGMYKDVVKQTTGSLKTDFKGKKIDWSKKWKKLDYFETVENSTGMELGKTSVTELKKSAKQLDLRLEKGWGKGRIIDHIFKKRVRPGIVQPAFLVNHPLEVSPLAKKKPQRPERVERFQIIAAGTELGNGYSELNDPLDQKERFKAQSKLRKAGDLEAQMMDESFVEALEYGMPPTAGFGVSERLFAVLMGRSIRETVVFPPMKRGDENE